MQKNAINTASILVAEDDDINRKVTSAMLRHLGYQVDAVSNGKEALTALKCKPYDIILMNLRMPEMDGLEATRVIRERCPPPLQPKIIALTAYVLPESRELCLNAGMNDFIPKPVRIEELAEILIKHIRILQRQTAFMLLHEETLKTLNSLSGRRKLMFPFKKTFA